MLGNKIIGQAAFDIETLVSAGQPSTIALIGSAEDAIADYVAQKNLLKDPCSVDKFTPLEALDKLKPHQRYDLVIAIDTLEHLEKDAARQLMAGVRDMHSRKFLVLLPMGPGHPNTRSEWQATELFGFGMTLVNRYQENRHAYHLYKYDIATYKKVPEWLNASRWANPELWNKYRW